MSRDSAGLEQGREGPCRDASKRGARRCKLLRLTHAQGLSAREVAARLKLGNRFPRRSGLRGFEQQQCRRRHRHGGCAQGGSRSRWHCTHGQWQGLTQRLRMGQYRQSRHDRHKGFARQELICRSAGPEALNHVAGLFSCDRVTVRPGPEACLQGSYEATTIPCPDRAGAMASHGCGQTSGGSSMPGSESLRAISCRFQV